MKKIFFLFGAICLGLMLHPQPRGTIKLYGFKQTVSSGKAPETTEGSDTKTSSGAGKNYFLYAVSSSRIYPSELWIEGARYGVTIKSITKTPVEYRDEANIGSSKKLLVPKTSQNVIQLIPAPSIKSKSVGTKAKALSKTNELVVVYKRAGKFYYDTLKTLSDLEGAAMQ